MVSNCSFGLNTLASHLFMLTSPNINHIRETPGCFSGLYLTVTFINWMPILSGKGTRLFVFVLDSKLRKSWHNPCDSILSNVHHKSIQHKWRRGNKTNNSTKGNLSLPLTFMEILTPIQDNAQQQPHIEQTFNESMTTTYGYLRIPSASGKGSTARVDQAGGRLEKWPPAEVRNIPGDRGMVRGWSRDGAFEGSRRVE